MRRLYSTFAGGWPGIGLIVLRLVLASVLLLAGGVKVGSHVSWPLSIAGGALAGSGVFLAVGLWTPLAGTFVAIAEICRILVAGENPLVCLLTGTIGCALAMLGPGRWSVDAHLFGWKRVEAAPRPSRTNVP